jgi:hypothetical protein
MTLIGNITSTFLSNLQRTTELFKHKTHYFIVEECFNFSKSKTIVKENRNIIKNCVFWCFKNSPYTKKLAMKNSHFFAGL